MWWCSRGRMDYRGRGRWVKEEMGKRKRGREQGEIVNQLLQDRRKPFIPTLSPHKNIQLLSLLHLPCIQMQCLHTLDRQLSLSLTHTHIQSSLQTNALLIKYWRGPVANWAEIQFLLSLVELSVQGRRKSQRKNRAGREGREERMRGGKREKSQQGCDYKKNDRKGEDGGWSRITKERRVRGELLHWAKHKMTDKVMYTRTEAKLGPWKTGSFILVTALTFTAWQM